VHNKQILNTTVSRYQHLPEEHGQEPSGLLHLKGSNNLQLSNIAQYCAVFFQNFRLVCNTA